MDLARDVLDKQVVDRNGREMGRVDGIVLALPDEGPPRVDAILIGASVLGTRLHPTLGRWAAALERLLGLDAQRPIRIDAGTILNVAKRVTVDRAVGESGADALEQRLRETLSKLPGAS